MSRGLGALGEAVREGQLRSPFTAILETFCESCVGAIAAGLVDEEGECVDFAQLPTLSGGARMTAYDVKLAGAYWQIVIRTAAESLGQRAWIGPVREMRIQVAQRSFLVRWMHAGYVLMLLCRPEALETVSRRALRQVEVELCREAGWPIPDPHGMYWRRVQVRSTQDGRPIAIRPALPDHLPPEDWDERIQVLGPAPRVGGFEKGFQILTGLLEDRRLVREPTGFWYLGMPLQVLETLG